MKKVIPTKRIHRLVRLCIAIFGVIFIIVKVYLIISPVWNAYTVPSYTEAQYKALEDLFNRSQYRIKENPAIIPDEAVYSYAAGAYIRGVDPIMINSESTPLGKYIIGLGILAFQNDHSMIFVFFLFTLFSVWLLGQLVLKDKILALIPVIVCLYERVITDQLLVAPLLDIIQLPFIFLSLYFFLSESKNGRFIKTPLCIGLVMATKSIVPAILLSCVFVLYLLYVKNYNSIKKLLFYSPIGLIVFIGTYTKTFLDGYSFWDFIGFQKWIFLYQKSKLEFPFSFWRFIYLNQWQAWWGDKGILKGVDWQITWPVFVTLPFIRILYDIVKKFRDNPAVILLLLYICVYEAFLSIGVVSSRFFLPLFPVCYIVGIDTVVLSLQLWKKRN